MAPAPTQSVRTINRGTGKPGSKPSCARAFFLTLIALAALLSALAIHLSHQLVLTQQSHQTTTPDGKITDSNGNERIGNEDSASSIAKSAELDYNNNVKNNLSNSVNVRPIPPNLITHDGKYSKDRVYCMIPFIWNEDTYKVIMETWGRRCDAINFLSDAVVGGKLTGDVINDENEGGLEGYKHYSEYPPGTFPENVIFINMTRPWNECFETREERIKRLGKKEKKVCRHIWEKMWRSWVYVDENHLDQAEWFCKVDYDTFFFPDNVKYFVHDQNNWDPFTEYHYFGHLIAHRKEGREPMIAGATACWSRKTLHDIAKVYREMPKGSNKGERGKCEDRAQATEEVTTSLCLKEYLNVDAEPARDEQLREYITLAKFKDVLTWNRTEQGEWWFWKGKPEGAGQMDDCCAIRPIGLHKFKLPKEIKEVEQQFFGEKGNPDWSKLNARTKRYVDKVRKAMGVDSVDP